MAIKTWPRTPRHEVGGRLGLEPAGVDHGGLPPLEGHRAVEAIAGDAGHVAHERAPVTDEPVEEGRFADIRPADDGDDGAHGSSLRRAGACRPRDQRADEGRGRGLDRDHGRAQGRREVGRSQVVEKDARPVAHGDGGNEHGVAEVAPGEL